LCKASVKEADITKLSNVEIFSEPDTEVFKLISLAPAKRQDWHSQTLSFKLHLDDLIGGETGSSPSLANQTTADSLTPEFNCTVVYLAQCMAMNKCKQNCNSMGASAFRWFHNACCECIGECDAAPFGDEEAKCEFCMDGQTAKGEEQVEEQAEKEPQQEGEGEGGVQGDEASNTGEEEEPEEVDGEDPDDAAL
ncbi:PREDICTED: twisted gastrulation protein homolog 1-A-like, partial [Rhagoletis zephyria]|uniref:twisted gastrulation protein homolog 1-A-like n=1 Tax=Rhagoletis zephyria TaxID=28612 RepID=UPI00081183C8